MIKTLKGRLALWYTVLFTLVSLGAFGFLHETIVNELNLRVDEGLLDDAEEIALIFDSEGVQKASEEILREVGGEDRGTVFYRIFSPRQEVVAASDTTSWGGLPARLAHTPPSDGYVYGERRVPGHQFEVRSIYYAMHAGHVLEVGVEPVGNGELFLLFDEAFGVSFGVLVGVGALLSFLISKRAFRGIDRLRLSFERVGRGDFSQAVATGQEGGEIESLISNFNLMQQRIQVLVEELRNVTNNIAHDLRSPVTRIRGMAETTLTGVQDISDYQEMAGNVVEECDTLVGMVNAMLEMAEADAGVTKIIFSSVDMSAIILDAEDLFLPLAEDKDIRLCAELPEEPLFVRGDRVRLQRALANLLDNALKYTPDGGTVTISTTTENGRVVVSVQDTGVGISQEDQRHVFDRFFRGDPSRSTPGNGLGLALVASIVRLHHGDIRVTSILNQGSCFQLLLPGDTPSEP